MIAREKLSTGSLGQEVTEIIMSLAIENKKSYPIKINYFILLLEFSQNVLWHLVTRTRSDKKALQRGQRQQ